MRMPSNPRRQRGAALIVVLVLLLIVTLLGLASLRGTLLEERMSANLYDRSLAFQSAESALREAEVVLSALDVMKKVPSANCAAGVCAIPVATEGGTPRWFDPAFTGWQAATKVSSLSTKAPEYIAEYMGRAPGWPGCDRLRPRNPQCMKPRFRVTARSAEDGRAQVYLQTSYAAQ